MSKASEAANGVMKGVLDMANLYRVPTFRMQSRTFMVADKKDARGARPMTVGEWIDDSGVKHAAGMSDWLLMPSIRTNLSSIAPPSLTEEQSKALAIIAGKLLVIEQIPLWVECKANTGKLSPKQVLFRDYVLRTGGYYLEVRNGPEDLEAWFKKHGVMKP